MKEDPLQRARELFSRVVELPPDQRRAFLDEQAADGPLRAELDSLLSHHEASSLFLAEPFRLTSQPNTDSRWIDLETPPLPERIGAYRIAERLGAGGMGVVYRAEQYSPRRSVALKVIRSGVSSRTVLQRFEHEAEALGRLQHPGIAQIFEAGTADTGHGPQPFFAMEYVRGVPLAAYAEQHQLGPRDRLGLLAAVCDAIHHAHQRGVIHRDIKPDNILVEPDGQPRILDFGVARVVDAEHHASLETQSGQLLGTVAYMSPEQISGDPNDIDIRTDVYALGVVGFELLCSRLPYDLSDKSLHAALQVVQTTDLPKLETFDRRYRGDVTTIIAKATEKPKERRYASVSDLAADIRRALRDEPISARPPTTIYQLSKLARRHRAAVAGACAVVVVLVLGVSGTSLGLFRALAAEELAVQEKHNAVSAANTAEAVTVFLQDMLGSVDPGMAQGHDVTVLMWMLDDAAHKVEVQLSDQPAARATVQETIGSAYKMIGRYDSAEPHLRDALATRLGIYGDEHVDVAHSKVRLGSLLVLMGNLDEARDLLKDGRELILQLTPNDQAALAAAHFELAELFLETTDYDASEVHCRQALMIWNTLHDPSSPQVARGLHGLGSILEAKSDYPAARELYEQALGIKEQHYGMVHPQMLLTMNNLATVVKAQGDYDAAAERFEQVLDLQRQLRGPQHPDVGTACKNLASAVHAGGDHKRAESLYREAVDIYRVRLDPSHPSITSTLSALGDILRTRGDYAAARTVQEESLQLLKERVGNDHVRVAAALNNFAGLLREMEELDDAAAAYDEVLCILRSKVGPTHQYIAATLNNVAALEQARSNYSTAESRCREALDIWIENFGEQHPSVASAQQNLATILSDQGRFQAAEVLYRTALQTRRELLGPEHPDVGTTLDNLGASLHDQDRFDEALPLHEEALRIRTVAFGEGSVRTSHSLTLLGTLYMKTDRPVEAEPYLRRALQAMTDVLPTDHTRVVTCARLLGKSLTAQRRFAESEPILLLTFQDSQGDPRVAEALVELYEAWDKPTQAGRYREQE